MDDLMLAGKRGRPMEAFLMAFVYGAACLTVFLLLGIVGYVFFRGFRHLSLGFFTTVTSMLQGTAGIAGNLVNTLYITLLTLLIAVPAGVGGAVYLNEYARPGKLKRLMESATEILAGIPSVVFGLFGLFFFGNVLGLGYSILNGAAAGGKAGNPDGNYPGGRADCGRVCGSVVHGGERKASARAYGLPEGRFSHTGTKGSGAWRYSCR